MTYTNTTQLRTTTFLLALLCACALGISTTHAGAGGGGDIGDPPPDSGGVIDGGGSGGGEDDPTEGGGETTTEETGGAGGGGEDDDTTPPVSTLLLNAEVNVNVYYTAVELTLTADDNSSGVEKIEYSLDGSGWLEYADPVLITTEGPHSVRYRSNDLAGNQELFREESFEILSLKGILETVLLELESDTSRAAHKARKMLDISLSGRYWEARNTLNGAGARSVLSHLENTLRFLRDQSYEAIREEIETALQKLTGQ